MRVALTTTGAFSVSAGDGEGDGVGLCARQRVGAAMNNETNNNQHGGHFHITSFLQFLRGGLVSPKRNRPRLSFFFLRRSFFARRCRRSAVTDRRYKRGTNEVERTNILASGLRRLTSRRMPSSRLHPREFSGIGSKGSRYPV